MTFNSNLGFGIDQATSSPTANRIPQADGTGQLAVGWIPDLIGSNGTTGGTHGLVPAPGASDNLKFLRGDGTWQTAGGGGGAILQTKLTSFTTSLTTTSTSFVDSGFSITLSNTLASSSNKVRIRVSLVATAILAGPSPIISFIIKRANTTDITPAGAAYLASVSIFQTGIVHSCSFEIDDAPGTTTPQSYNLWWKQSASPAATARLNGDIVGNVNALSMSAMEFTP